MYKSFFLSLISILIFLFTNISAQDNNSVQINGGIIYPMSSSNGLTGIIQYNYSINKQIYLYIYSGYSSWDRFNITFLEDHSEVQKQTKFISYSADQHKLIPVYIGSRINFHTNKLFTSFVNLEIGYSYLSYNSYTNRKSVDPETGEVLSYYVDGSTKEEITENLIGVGIGAGISHPVTENLNLILTFKLNSYLNSEYYGFFRAKGTYTMFLAGFSYDL